MEMEAAQRELAHALGVMREDLPNFLIKNIALPVGATGLAGYGLTKILGSTQPDYSRLKAQQNVSLAASGAAAGGAASLVTMLPVVLKIMKDGMHIYQKLTENNSFNLSTLLSELIEPFGLLSPTESKEPKTTNVANQSASHTSLKRRPK